MYHAGTIGQGDISVTNHIVSFLALLCTDFVCKVKEGNIFLVFQILTGHCLQYFISCFCFHTILRVSLHCQLAQNGIKQCLRHVVGIAVCGGYLCVGLARVYAKCHVGGQGPRGGGPCKDIRILVLYLEACDCGTLLYVLIALCNLCGG